MTVDRNDLAGAHRTTFPTRDLVDRHIFERVSALAVCDARRAIDERFQISFRAPDRVVFQRLAAGIHDGDDRPGQGFVKRKSRRHR